MSSDKKAMADAKAKGGESAAEVTFPPVFDKYNLNTQEQQVLLLAFLLIAIAGEDLTSITWYIPGFKATNLFPAQHKKAVTAILKRLTREKLLEDKGRGRYMVTPLPFAIQRQLFALPLVEPMIKLIMECIGNQTSSNGYGNNASRLFTSILACGPINKKTLICQIHRDILNGDIAFGLQCCGWDIDEYDYQVWRCYSAWLAPTLMKEPDGLAPETFTLFIPDIVDQSLIWGVAGEALDKALTACHLRQPLPGVTHLLALYAWYTWRASRDGLQGLERETSRFGLEKAVKACLALLDGDHVAADKLFAGVLSLVTEKRNRWRRLTDVKSCDMSACGSFFCLAQLAAIRANTSKTSIKRLLDLSGSWFYRHGPKFTRLVDLACNGALVTSPSQVPVEPRFADLGSCLESLFLDDTALGGSLKNGCLGLLRTARENGYHYLAAILDPCARRLDPVRGEEYVSTAPPASQCAPLWQESCSKPLWQHALEELHELLPDGKASTGADDTRSHLVEWRIVLRSLSRRRNADTPERVEISDIGARILKRLKSGKWSSSGSYVDRCSIVYGKYEEFFDANDHAIKNALITSAKAYYYDTAITAEVATALIGHPRIYVIDDVRYNIGDADEGPVQFVEGKPSVEVKNLPGGGVSLRIPAIADGFGASLHVVRERGDLFVVYKYTDAQLKLGEIVQRFGANGRLNLPPEAVPRFQSLLPALAREVGVRGEFDTEDVAARIIDGATRLILRGKFVNSVLQLELLNSPIDDFQFYVAPGIGMRNTLTQHEGETIAVVRDLAAEKCAATAFSAACPALAAWNAGNWRWEVSDLRAILDVLDECHAQAENVTLEWPERDALEIVRPTGTTPFRLSAVGGSDFWLEIGGDIVLDNGQVMAFTELLAHASNRTERFVRLGDKRFMRLTRHLAEQLELLAKAGTKHGEALRVPQGALPILEAIAEKAPEISFPEVVRRRIGDFREALDSTYKLPASLTCEPRQYQREGFEWLAKLDGCGLGACLADDMGLGKTLQALALLTHAAARGPSLVIVPTSVSRNWQKEAVRFAPALNFTLLADANDRAALVNGAKPYDVVVCSYGMMLFEEELLAGREWNIIVLDEAQAVKNRLSKRAGAVKRLRGVMRVAVTGTPVENNLAELWNLFDFLNPGLLGTHRQLEQRFCNPDGSVGALLKRFTDPFILRRLKSDVLDDLPSKTEITLSVTLDDSERALYESCRRDALATITTAADEPNHIVMLAQLTRLRRLCCHPSLVLRDSQLPGQKVEQFMELVDDLRAGGHRALVFSQFVSFLSIIRTRLDKAGVAYQYLDGATPLAQRNQAVERFQRGEGNFFLISLKAGGTGLNLTAADYVVLLDPWWNPAVEAQATDRANRIGQTKPVTVYRLVTADTIEERVVELHAHKQAIAAAILDGTGDTRLTAEDFMRLLT